MKYNLDFKYLLLGSLTIMIWHEIWKLLAYLPEQFPFGNELYIFFSSIFSLLSNLAISIVAAVAFYFASQYINKRKDYDFYTELRKELLFTFYGQLKILSRTPTFSRINDRTDRFLNSFDTTDIPLLLDITDSLIDDNKLNTFYSETRKVLNNISIIELKKINTKFEEYMSSILSIKEYRYYKGSKDSIDSLHHYYDEYVWFVESILDETIDRKIEVNQEDYAERLYNYLLETKKVYEEVQLFIDTLDKNQIIRFVKMLD